MDLVLYKVEFGRAKCIELVRNSVS